jgi:hypothetical protein
MISIGIVKFPPIQFFYNYYNIIFLNCQIKKPQAGLEIMHNGLPAMRFGLVLYV